ncbi:SMI1/KNR4 family protein [Shewanella sp. A3A]|nr:SMI1/KNR4 family protein [Shewanella ferrihydritica]
MDYAKHLAAHTLQGGLNVAPTESIPAAMRGAPNTNAPVWAQDDWSEWHTVASPLTTAELEAFEQQFAVALPQQFRQYLMACCHIFSEMPAASFADSIYIANTPSNAPLMPLTHIINSAERLLDAGYLPIGDWGLGYGPVCFDVGQRGAQLTDAPIVWFDHEQLAQLDDEQLQQRQSLAPLAQPLYSSFVACFADTYAAPAVEQLTEPTR